jgi:hypothetical protein
MAIQSANTYQSAIALISAKQGAVFEVTKDGGIREQTGFEKFKLFVSKLVRSYDSKRDSKDAAVANALSQLQTKGGQASIDPLHNGVTKRFFDAQRRIDQRTAKRTDQVRQDNDNLDRLRNQSTKKQIKNADIQQGLNRKAQSKEVASVASTTPVASKKTLADYKSVAPRGVILDSRTKYYDHAKVNPKNIYTEEGLRKLIGDDPELAALTYELQKKSSDPTSITPEEYHWLHPEDQELNQAQRFSSYTAPRIQKGNIIFNDRLKLALYDIAKANQANNKRPGVNEIARLAKNLEGIWSQYEKGPLDCVQLSNNQHRVDFNQLNILLGEYGLTLGEGDLAQFAGADFDIVKWSEAAGEAPIPRSAKSPLVFHHLSEASINDRVISDIPFDKRANGIKL